MLGAKVDNPSNPMNITDIYLSGEKLWGDDFNLEQIQKWYEDEKQGYAELGAKDKSSYKYVYHSLNKMHGFNYLPDNRFRNVLGLGSAYGDEFLPIADRIDRLTILDPSDAFESNKVHGIPSSYVKPSIDGRMSFEDDSFDLITCLGVLHHIPNVTFVVKEVFRCLSPHGYTLVREPIVSMGDWSKLRPGLTKRERGIPLEKFRSIIQRAGFQIRHETLWFFPPIPKLAKVIRIEAYNSQLVTRIDELISKRMKWNVHYHSQKLLHKFRPRAVYFVLEK